MAPRGGWAPRRCSHAVIPSKPQLHVIRPASEAAAGRIENAGREDRPTRRRSSRCSVDISSEGRKYLWRRSDTVAQKYILTAWVAVELKMP